MSVSEEQCEEMEALASIFGDDFEATGDSSHTVFIAPYQGTGSDDNHVAVKLVTVMPLDYPSVLPELSIEVVKGLTPGQAAELLLVANRSAEENLGTPSIYMVSENVREWLLDHNIAGQDGSMYAEMMRKEAMKGVQDKRKEERASRAAQADYEKNADAPTPEELERTRRRQAGTPVTMESFIAWKAKFDGERRRAGLIKEDDAVDELRPTGKQLFLLNQAGREEEVLESGDIKEEGGHDDDDEDDSDYVDGEEDDDEEDDEDYEDE